MFVTPLLDTIFPSAARVPGAQAASSRRLRYTYGFDASFTHDEALLVSYLAVVASRLRHDWVRTEAAEAAILITAREPHSTHAGACIVVGNVGDDRTRRLVWPLRVSDVVAHFDAAGEILERQRSTPNTAASLIAVRAANDEASFARPAVQHRMLTNIDRGNVRLMRWPDHALIRAHPAHIKIAATMVGRVSTVDELVAQTGSPRALCAAFVQTLIDRGFASVSIDLAVDAAPKTRASAPPTHGSSRTVTAARGGLLQMIRRRLSL